MSTNNPNHASHGHIPQQPRDPGVLAALTASTALGLMLVFAACGADSNPPNGGGSSYSDTTCSPSERKCQLGVMLECRTNGTGYDQTVCNNGCNAQGCLTCTPNSTRCDGNLLFSCGATGMTQTSQSCRFGCQPANTFGSSQIPGGGAATASNATCKTQLCTQGQKVCRGTIAQTCIRDSRGQLTYQNETCQFGCQNGECIQQACTPGQQRCNANNTALLVCDSATRRFVPQSCGSQGCQPGTGVGGAASCRSQTCTPGQTRCGGTDGKTIERCNTGGTGFVATQTICHSGCDQQRGTCMSCTANSRVCIGDEVHACNASETALTLDLTCPNGCVTIDDGRASCGACRQSSRRCTDEGEVEVCNEPLTGWTNEGACPEDAECFEGSCTEVISFPDPTSDDANYVAFVNAATRCWNLGGGDNRFCFGGADEDVLCGRIAAKDVSTGLTEDDVYNWVCNVADASDVEDLETAKFLFGDCDEGSDRIDWKDDGSPSGQTNWCMWYDTRLCDEVFVGACDNDIIGN